MIFSLPRFGNQATVPFIGFAEAFVLSSFRKAGVPMQRIRPAVERLKRELGITHALASKRLYTDGAEVLFRYADDVGGPDRNLVVVRNGQKQFSDTVEGYLRRISFNEDDPSGQDIWARSIRFPLYRDTEAVISPEIAFGLPRIAGTRVRVEDLVDRFKGGDTPAAIATDFELEPGTVEDAIRVFVKA